MDIRDGLLEADSPCQREDAEKLSRHISLHAWLLFKYPPVLWQGNQIVAAREKLGRDTEQGLLTQTG